ncbi:hypothetical protein [Vannielia sp. SX4]|uniref:hypothetical protein n=1 Tax=Vannielia sp. SX4 TaxID=3463852 RepID=UPI00405845F6
MITANALAVTARRGRLTALQRLDGTHRRHVRPCLGGNVTPLVLSRQWMTRPGNSAQLRAVGVEGW